MRIVLLILTFLSPLLTAAQLPASVDTALFSRHKLQHSNGADQYITLNAEPLHVLVFLSPECPLSISYTKSLNELARSHAGKIKLIGIVPGKSYTAATVNKFVSDYKLTFPVYIDKEKWVTKSAKATVTPEVVAFSANGTIVYRGAIDDWAIAPGKKKQKATTTYLNDAVDAFLLGKKIPLLSTKPVGCLINDY